MTNYLLSIVCFILLSWMVIGIIELFLNTERRKLKRKLVIFAKNYGIALNKDRQLVNILIKSLINQTKKWGVPYCPCKPLREEQNICPCFSVLNDIKKTGKCHCGLFVGERKLVD